MAQRPEMDQLIQGFYGTEEKTAKNELFLVISFHIEIRTLSRIISLKHADFLVLTGIVVLGSVWGEREQ